eukprot:CAMPEP_0178440936 /NCGR_PEP_ID=MMETSP0689_2-20121128/37144_1 /TAXON_ID=160604 /ORGANISM="Amphidinium massartii, Strain CS-259" /LENGTH=75 /DNA_ID=CAMNT_0020063943 /DNA_START=23 /DNA_END=247 /DNA_ORIENTATION=+
MEPLSCRVCAGALAQQRLPSLKVGDVGLPSIGLHLPEHHTAGHDHNIHSGAHIDHRDFASLSLRGPENLFHLGRH